MNKTHLLVLGLALALPAAVRGAGGVSQSPHDLSLETWNTRKGVCSPCHAAHHTDPAQIAPLWVHATSTATFTPYSSPTMNAGVGQPSGASLACLSCHDGTLAINQQISGPMGGTASEPIDAGAQIGPDLHTTHPISFVYDSALAAADGGLEDPAVYTIGSAKTRLTDTTPPVPASWSGTSLTGKTIQQALLGGGTRMECSSCHDVHKMDGASPTSGILARISGNDANGKGSTLCRTCHVK